MNFVGFDKQTTLIHTKISSKYKATIEKIAEENGVDENIVFNSVLQEGLKRVKISAPVKK